MRIIDGKNQTGGLRLEAPGALATPKPPAALRLRGGRVMYRLPAGGTGLPSDAARAALSSARALRAVLVADGATLVAVFAAVPPAEMLAELQRHAAGVIAALRAEHLERCATGKASIAGEPPEAA
jgi:hypothetical protein